MSRAEIRATYRVQLHAGFPLVQARALVPYLGRLGISHLHCSPILQARRGSTHGYDVTDPSRLNPELGSEDDLAALVSELRRHQMGLLLDIVPNHMAATSENPAWEDVLMHGPASRFARWFDVEWRAAERELRYRVMLPILGDHRAQILERGELGVMLEAGRLRLRYYEHEFPLDPGTMPLVLRPALARCEQILGSTDAACRELGEVVQRLRRLPRRTVKGASAIAARQELAAREMERLRDLCRRVPTVEEAIRSSAEEFGSGLQGAERLRRLLDAQAYRLVYWRRAAREINYRRFFDVNDLIALHMEDPEVFAQTHALVLEWVRREWVDGFRIDHPDGLLDPLDYLRRLSSAAFPSSAPPPIYVEKILSHGERLRPEWPVSGTTGYDFLNRVEALFIGPAGAQELERNYRRIIRQPLEFAAIARLAKRRALESGLSAGARRLAERLLKLGGPELGYRRLKTQDLYRAIVETIASLEVYRTYVDPGSPVPSNVDRGLLEAALADARSRGRASPDALALLSAALLAEDGPMRSGEWEGLRLRFVQRFQQLSGPATAKGVEDTAFYSYAPLLSRNEVGGAPDASLSQAVEEFHIHNEEQMTSWPRAMLTVTTHDTKRTADARGRLDVLSEIPAEWEAAVERWRDRNMRFKRMVHGRRYPDPNTVYHLMQALVAIWPLGDEPASILPAPTELASLRERMKEYAVKAAREAKLRTSWTDPDEVFEEAVTCYVEAILNPEQSAEFQRDFADFVGRIAGPAQWNSLSRTLLQLTAPGVPDLYQGDELWNLALVDPDNRRPVDFERRFSLLEEISAEFSMNKEEFLRAQLRPRATEALKLHVIRSALELRRQQPALFLRGAYLPLVARGAQAGHVVGFCRVSDSRWLIVLTGRLLSRAIVDGGGSPPDSSFWRGTRVSLPDGAPSRWKCSLSERVFLAAEGELELGEIFGQLPLALLEG